MQLHWATHCQSGVGRSTPGLLSSSPARAHNKWTSCVPVASWNVSSATGTTCESNCVRPGYIWRQSASQQHTIVVPVMLITFCNATRTACCMLLGVGSVVWHAAVAAAGMMRWLLVLLFWLALGHRGVWLCLVLAWVKRWRREWEACRQAAQVGRQLSCCSSTITGAHSHVGTQPYLLWEW